MTRKSVHERPQCVIIGAGPAGLTAAYELSENGADVVVLEQDRIVGGIARTVEHNGYRFDIGGHRFFSKVPVINEWWTNILGDEFQPRSRLSRIYYNGKFFDYPLRPMNALRGLGPVEAMMIMASYVRARTFPTPEEKNFEEWVCNRFGRRLFEIFFKTYTEKVWGMKCSEIGADWASQRIKNLNLAAALKDMVGGRKEDITTLIRQFHYPRLGPGMMWEKVTDILNERGVPVRLGLKVDKVNLAGGLVIVGDHGRRGREGSDSLRRSFHLFHADQGIDRRHEPGASGARAGGRTATALPRLSHRGLDRQQARSLSGQLDLHPLA